MKESKRSVPGFAALGNRLVAQWIDLVLLFFIGIWVADALRSPMQLTPEQVAETQKGLMLGVGFFCFALLPLTRVGGSPGKWMVGIRLRDRRGGPPTLRQCMIRAVAMLLWFWTIPHLGWLVASRIESLEQHYWTYYPVWAYLPHVSTAMLISRRSLFDLVSGTAVATRDAVSLDLPPLSVTGLLNPLRIAGVALAYILLFGFLSLPLQMMNERELRARMNYAIAETTALRERSAQFRAREGRWPTAGDAGIPASTPYPDGGFYRTLEDGSIEIAFTVKPGLKGRTLSLRPTWIAGEARAEWKCTPDPGLRRPTLPPACR